VKLSCLIGRHSPRPDTVRNQGFTFGRCAACGRDLVRSMGRWQTVPKGFRIVWRNADGTAPAAATATTPSARATEGALARFGEFGALAGAGLRAFAWGLGDRFDGWSRRIRIQRRPALLRLPAP
jgi:hypothetical protein